MMNQPLVTIGIPAFNCERFVLEAVQSSLQQSYPALEVVVVDDASSDNTYQVLANNEHPRLRLYRNKTRLGMTGNWNRCLELARGEYFLLLPHDDTLSSDAIEKMVFRFLSEPEKIAFCNCRMGFADAAGNVTNWVPDPPASDDSWDFVVDWFRGKRAAPPCNTLFRTQDLRDNIGGGYNKNYGLSADIGACLEILARYPKVAYEAAAFACFREHGTNLTHSSRFSHWMKANRSIYKLTAKLVPDSYRYRVCMATDRFMLRFITKNLPWKQTSFRRYCRIVNPFLHWRYGFIVFKGGYRLAFQRLLCPNNRCVK